MTKEAAIKIAYSLSPSVSKNAPQRKGSSYIWANDHNATARVHVKAEKIGSFQKSYAQDVAALQSAASPFEFDVKLNSKPGLDHKVLKMNGKTFTPKWKW